MPTRIALIGPGAIGGAVAAHLSTCENLEINLAARTRFAELLLESSEAEPRHIPARFLAATDQPAPFDWMLIATKAYDVAGTAPWLATLVGPNTRVAVLRNGVEHRERFQSLVPAAQLLPVMVDLPASRLASGHIRQHGRGVLRVPDGDIGEAFCTLFAGTSIDAATVNDFTTCVWRKLTLNAPGAVNALLLQPTRIVAAPAVANLIRGLMREAIAVGRAEGAVLGNELIEAVITGMRQAPPDSVNSLHADRRDGRPMETDARNGAIVRFGRRHGIPTPLNAMAVTLLEAGAANCGR
ncbi:MAG: 2-dehydropantoate 2-reductase [Cephaloticoccus sp.]